MPALDLEWRSGPEPESLVDLIYARLDDFEVIAIHDLESFLSRVFFKNPEQREAAASALVEAFGAQGLSVAPLDVEDENWAKRSQEDLHAVAVGRIVVAPPWDVHDSPPDTIGIVIEPSTGFGTGHHETTRLCLGLLQELTLEGVRAIDVGTGSGVLAIAASKLGASTVVAFDDDPDALDNARENVERNGVASTVVVRELDLGSPAFDLQPAAVVTANLTSGVLLKYARRLAAIVEPGGALLISGFSPDDLAELVETFGASEVHPEVEGAWAAAVLRFTAAPAEN